MDVKTGWQQKGMSEIASFHYTLPSYWESLSCLNTFSPFASWFLLYTFMHAYFHILMFLYTRWSHQSHEFVYFIRFRCPWALPVLCVYSSTKVESLPSSKETICTAVILWNQLISKTSVQREWLQIYGHKAEANHACSPNICTHLHYQLAEEDQFSFTG